MTGARLKRAELMLSRMEDSGTAVINRWSGGNKEQVGASRFLRSERVELGSVTALVRKRTLMAESYNDHVLVFQDTSEFNYDHLNGSLKVNDPEIGLLSDNASTGVLLHAGLAVKAVDHSPLGISGLHIWHRPFVTEGLSKQEKWLRPYEEKESYKWARVAEQSKNWSGAGGSLTLIGDRENDIYEYLSSIPDERTDVLVRSLHDRTTSTGQHLSARLSEVDWSEGPTVDLKGNEKRKAREAVINIRWTEVELSRPGTGSSTLEDRPSSLPVSVVEALESERTVPEGESPVHWRLLTTHPVNDKQDALRMIEWYKKRWMIEDMFRIMKTKGLEVESIQHHTGLAIKKMVILSTDTAVRILALRQGRHDNTEGSADHIFDQGERDFMERLNEELEGNTERQRNPFIVNSLGRYVWVIAVLAGWKPGDMIKRPPGVITLTRGLRLMEQQYQGWQAALTYFQEKSKNGP